VTKASKQAMHMNNNSLQPETTNNAKKPPQNQQHADIHFKNKFCCTLMTFISFILHTESIFVHYHILMTGMFGLQEI